MKTVLLTVVIPPEESHTLKKGGFTEERITIELPLEVVKTMLGTTGHVSGHSAGTYRQETSEFRDRVQKATGLRGEDFWDRFVGNLEPEPNGRLRK